MKLLTYSKNPSSNPLAEAAIFYPENVFGRNPTVVLKCHSGSHLGNVHLRGFVLRPMWVGR
jgi:hypothetical protein